MQVAPPDFEVSQEGDQWVALHVETGIASHADTASKAVEMAEEAVELHSQAHHPGDEAFQEEMLRAHGIDPADVNNDIESVDGMP